MVDSARKVWLQADCSERCHRWRFLWSTKTGSGSDWSVTYDRMLVTIRGIESVLVRQPVPKFLTFVGLHAGSVKSKASVGGNS